MATLCNLLKESGFTDHGVLARLRIQAQEEFVSLRNGRQVARDLETPLDVLIRLFLDGDCVEDATCRSIARCRRKSRTWPASMVEGFLP